MPDIKSTVDTAIAIYGVVFIVFSAGGTFAGIRFGMKGMQKDMDSFKSAVRDDLTRLEVKQDKYNNLQERVAIEERDIKSAHNRLDDRTNICSSTTSKMETKIDGVSSKIDNLVVKVIEALTTLVNDR